MMKLRNLIILSISIFATAIASNFCNAFYDPGVGRFCSRDPIGYSPVQNNLSEYVASNPLYYVDPLGLERVLPIPSKVPKIDPKNPPTLPPFAPNAPLPDPLDGNDPFKPQGKNAQRTIGYLIITCNCPKPDSYYIPIVSGGDNSYPGYPPYEENNKRGQHTEEQCRAIRDHYKQTDDFKDCEFSCWINNVPCPGCEKIDDIPIYHPGPKDPTKPYKDPKDPLGPIIPSCTKTPEGWVCQNPPKR